LVATAEAALHAPRLPPAEVQRVRAVLAALGARDPDEAARLSEALAQRLRDWDILFDLRAPFEGLAEVFGPGRVAASHEALAARKGQGLVVPTRVACEGNVQIEAEFAPGGWEAAPSVGLVLNDNQGHSKAVRAVAWAPDGQTLASASEDGTVKL